MALLAAENLVKHFPASRNLFGRPTSFVRAVVDELFASPQHPYTVGLLGSIPRLDHRTEQLATIEGMVPNMANPPAGCRFAPRCPFVVDACTKAPPQLAELSPGHASRCIRAPLERLVS